MTILENALEHVESHLHPEPTYDVEAHPTPTGMEEIWRFTPLKRLGGLLDGTPSEAHLDWKEEIPDGATLSTITTDEAKALNVAAPFDRLGALAVANAGYLPAYVTQRALERKTVRGVMFEIHMPSGEPGISLVRGKERMEGPQLEGHAPRQSQLAFLPDKHATGDRAVAEWVVRAPVGTRLALSASAERAGVVRTEVVLD